MCLKNVKIKLFQLSTRIIYNGFILAVLLSISEIVFSQSVINESINLRIENDRILKLENRLSNTTWQLDNVNLFNINTDGVSTKLEVNSNEKNQIKLELTITNISKKTVYPNPVFPIMNGIYLPDTPSRDLYYLFPSQGSTANNIEPITLDGLYSSVFPLQFMDVYNSQNGGFYVMTNDTTNYPKRYVLSKKDGKVNMQIFFKTRALQPGESWKLPTVMIGMHKNDWHEALYAYKTWVKSWYKPYTSQKKWFHDIYNFRQVFLHTTFGEVGAWNPKTKKIDLISKIEADKEAFGGVDYVHIFDWMKTPKGRIVDYDPWSYLGGYQDLANQIKRLQKEGINVGLYHEGYIMNKESEIGIKHGKEWQTLDANGMPYTRYGVGNYYPCPLIRGWQDYLSDLVKNSSSLLNTNGVYLDQYGFGWHYACFNSTHKHDVYIDSIKNNQQVISEAMMGKSIKDKLPNDQVLYIEENPTDVSTQYYDGSFSYAVQKGRQLINNNPSCVNLTRFALPDFKLFEILRCDRPIGNDTDGIKHIFFNGEGIWIAGPLNDPNWFAEDVRKMIRKTYSILSEHKDAFQSKEAIPLVPTLQDSIFANYFPTNKKNLWTLYNAGIEKQKGVIIKIPHKQGATYFDAWNKMNLTPKIVNDYALVSVNIDGRDAGCIIQNY